MEYILLIVIAYYLLSFAAKIMRHFMSSETVAVWIIAFALMMIPHWGWTGLVVLAWRYIVIPIGRYEEKQRRKGRKSSLSNSSVMWMIPLFWPFLIAKMLFSGKVEKTDMSYADYIEHQRRNAK